MFRSNLLLLFGFLSISVLLPGRIAAQSSCSDTLSVKRNGQVYMSVDSTTNVTRFNTEVNVQGTNIVSTLNSQATSITALQATITSQQNLINAMNATLLAQQALINSLNSTSQQNAQNIQTLNGAGLNTTTYSWSAVATGPWANQDCTVKFTQIGKFVTMLIPQIVAPLTVTGVGEITLNTFPPQFTPSGGFDMWWVVTVVTDNVPVQAVLTIEQPTIFIDIANSATKFTGSGVSNGMLATTISWTVS